MIKEILEAIEYIKSVIETTATASVKAITQTVFGVRIQNEELSVKVANEKPLDVKGNLNVNNFPDHTKEWIELQRLLERLPELLKRLDKDQKVKVENLNEIKIPNKIEVTNPQKKVEVTNLDALYKAVLSVKEAVNKLPQEYPEVKIPETKIPPYPKFPEIKIPKAPEFPKEITVKDMQRLIKLAEKLTAGNAKDPIAVRLSDGKEFYEALTEVLTTSGGNSVPFTYRLGGRESGLLTPNREQVVSMVERYTNNDIDTPDQNTTYIGQENTDGEWLIQRIVLTGTINAFRYATIKNNSNKTTYTSAWTARLSLSYGTVSESLT